MARKEKKDKKRKAELDVETTVADMNVEGFSWYDPKRKGKKPQATKLTKKEYWAMVRGAFVSMLPLIGCMLVAGGLMVLLAVLWLS